MLGHNIMIPRDFVMPLDLYQKVGGYDSEINRYEDWDLNLRLAEFGLFQYTGLKSIGYRRHDTGLSAVPAFRHKEAQAKIILKNLYLFTEKLTMKGLPEIVQRLGVTSIAGGRSPLYA